MEKNLFQEEQKFNRRLLIVIFLVSFFSVISPFLYGIYSQEVLHKPFGDKPISTGGLIIIGFFTTAIVVGANWLILRMNLKTKITGEAIWVCFPPLIRKWEKILPDQIEKYEIRIYNSKREFGGHGIKRRFKYGTSYTVSGNTGLQLYFKNGKKLLIGTQKKQAIEYAMGKLMKGENSV